MTIEAINPATAERIAGYEEMSIEDARMAVGKSHQAFLGWRQTSFRTRAGLLRTAAQILRAKAVEYGRLMAQEMGKPVRDGVAEAQKCALGCDFYAENAERFLAPDIVKTEARKSYVAFRPLGVILAIMPWNFPFWQVFRFAAPTLMAGNAIVDVHQGPQPIFAAMKAEAARVVAPTRVGSATPLSARRRPGAQPTARLVSIINFSLCAHRAGSSGEPGC